MTVAQVSPEQLIALKAAAEEILGVKCQARVLVSQLYPDPTKKLGLIEIERFEG